MASMLSPAFYEARFDPINERAVLIAPRRAKRPNVHEEHECPGCVAALTPPAVYVYPEDAAPDGETWDVRVVPNKFSCFSDGGQNLRYESRPGFKGIHDPAGRCEVVFETRRHTYPVYARTAREIQNCFGALAARYRFARHDPCARYWFGFKNLGRTAGGTLEHEHWQLYTLPFIPPSIQDRYAHAAQHFNQTGQNLYSQVFDDEAECGDRVVAKSEHFVTFVPWAAGMPYELCIAPLRGSADFSTMTDEEMLEFATSFRDAISRLNAVHSELAFNVALHTAAFEHSTAPWFTWHLSIMPRLTTLAGVELGINLMVSPIAPEEAASTLRSAVVE
jgi:UDPglucose--hexose-1-phosphate uridylyltransferase